MSGITLSIAQQILDGLLAVQLGGAGSVKSFTIGDRTVSYQDAADLLKQINYWQRVVSDLQRSAAGAPRHGRSRATFC